MSVMDAEHRRRLVQRLRKAAELRSKGGPAWADYLEAANAIEELGTRVEALERAAIGRATVADQQGGIDMPEPKLSPRELVAWLRTAHGNATRIHDTADALEAALDRNDALEALLRGCDDHDQDLNTIMARADAATAGPWSYERWPKDEPHAPLCIFETFDDEPPLMALSWVDDEQAQADAEFVAHARDDVPMLAARLRAARARIRELEEAKR